MNKIVLLAVAVIAAAMMAGTALAQPPVGAGAGKAPMYDALDNPTSGYTCPGGADVDDLEALGTFGFAVINTNGNGDLIVQVSLKGAVPSTYDVYVHQNVGGSCSPTLVGQLTTNGKGNGNAHAELERTANATDFWVSLVDTGTDERYRTTSVQLD